MPSLIGSRDDVDESLRNLEVHFLANMIGDIHFALLSDWPDSPSSMSAGDREVLDYARSEIKLLNERHPLPGGERFHLLHRRRLYNEAEGCWMGWERKRGKLHELNLLLRGDSDTTFLPPETRAAGQHRPRDDARCRHAHDARRGDTARRQAVARRSTGRASIPRPAASCAATASCSRG